MDKALSQVIDFQVEKRTPEEIACAYRAICTTILLRSAICLAGRGRYRRDDIENRAAAQRWIKDDKSGTVTFQDVCNTLDLDPDLIRRGIEKHALKMSDPAIKKSRKPITHYVFGRRQHAIDPRETQAGP